MKDSKLRLRAMLDLRNHKFKKDQKYGVIGSLNQNYPNRLADNDVILRDMRLNKDIYPHRLLEIGVRKYLIICLIHAQDEYLFEKQAWIEGVENKLEETTLNYITLNLVDLLIIKDANAPITCRKMNQIFQSAISNRKIEYAKNPSNSDFQNHLLSTSNCATLYDSFQFRSYQAGMPTAGLKNDCSGGRTSDIEEKDKSGCEKWCSNDNVEIDKECSLNENDKKEVMQEILQTYDHSAENPSEDARGNPSVGAGENTREECPSSTEDASGKNTMLNVIFSRKRKFFELSNQNYDDKRWNREEKFKVQWVDMINRYQSDIIPIEEFKAARSWIEYIPNHTSPRLSHYRCGLCYANIHLYGTDNAFTSPLAHEEGQLYPSLYKNKKAIEDHWKNPTQLALIERMKDEQILAAYDDIFFVEERQLMVTTQVMRTVYMAVKKMGSSFQSMEHLIRHMRDSGVDMGTICQSRTSIVNMVSSISKSLDKRLIKQLKHGTSPLTIITDSSTDVSKKDVLAVLIRTIGNSNL